MRCRIFQRATAFGCITKRPAAAQPSSSCMNMPATTVAGKRRCGTSRARTAASRIASAAIRPPTCRNRAARYGQDIARDDVIALMDALKIDKAHVVGHSMGALHSIACRHAQGAGALHFGGRRRLWLGLERPTPRSGEEMKALACGDRQRCSPRRASLVRASAKYADAPNAAGAEKQGSARLR